jgi:uncharacterized protein DUF2785
VSDAAYWEKVVAQDCAVPDDRPLDDMTVELVELLGAADPHLRDDLALRVLCAWVSDGVFDDLLGALGDGVCEGLRPGVGQNGSPSVFRRSYSARVLAAVIERDNRVRALLPATVLHWGDRGLGWLVAERDLRGHVGDSGRAHAVAHGADLIRALAMSRHLDEGGLMVLLDSIADRLLTPTQHVFTNHEDDRLAYATMALLHRDLVDMTLLGPWTERLAAAWSEQEQYDAQVPPQSVNTLAFVRALHLQLLLGVRAVDKSQAEHFAGQPAIRVELLAALQRMLRTTGPYYRKGPS